MASSIYIVLSFNCLCPTEFLWGLLELFFCCRGIDAFVDTCLILYFYVDWLTIVLAVTTLSLSVLRLRLGCSVAIHCVVHHASAHWLLTILNFKWILSVSIRTCLAINNGAPYDTQGWWILTLSSLGCTVLTFQRALISIILSTIVVGGFLHLSWVIGILRESTSKLTLISRRLSLLLLSWFILRLLTTHHFDVFVVVLILDHLFSIGLRSVHILMVYAVCGTHGWRLMNQINLILHLLNVNRISNLIVLSLRHSWII